MYLLNILQDYLENILEIKGKFYNEYEQKTRIKSAIQIYFKDRDCFTLVRPVEDEKMLQQLAEIDPKLLREEFVD